MYWTIQYIDFIFVIVFNKGSSLTFYKEGEMPRCYLCGEWLIPLIEAKAKYGMGGGGGESAPFLGHVCRDLKSCVERRGLQFIPPEEAKRNYELVSESARLERKQEEKEAEERIERLAATDSKFGEVWRRTNTEAKERMEKELGRKISDSEYKQIGENLQEWQRDWGSRFGW